MSHSIVIRDFPYPQAVGADPRHPAVMAARAVNQEVLLDGKPVACRAVSVQHEVGQPPVVVLEIVCASVRSEIQS